MKVQIGESELSLKAYTWAMKKFSTATKEG
jgi:hypothetical protein